MDTAGLSVTFARRWGIDAGRFHILDHVDRHARYMACGKVLNDSTTVEVRFDFTREELRTMVCGLCLVGEQSS